MKLRTQIISVAIVTISFLLSSCGSSMESDANKLAQLTCKSLKMMGKFDETSLTESLEVAAEIEKLNEKLDKKYPTEAEQKELQKLYAQSLLDLGCK